MKRATHIHTPAIYQASKREPPTTMPLLAGSPRAEMCADQKWPLEQKSKGNFDLPSVHRRIADIALLYQSTIP